MKVCAELDRTVRMSEKESGGVLISAAKKN